MNGVTGNVTEIAQIDTGGRTAQANLPAHEVVYRKLRAMVLFGDLSPGQAVTIQGLVDQLGVGMTPVREAIRRLVPQGALESRGNRRVSVPLLEASSIAQIIIARQWLDPHLALKACERASDEDVADLAALDERLDRAIEDGDHRAYLELNYRFHRRIYDMADAPILAEMAEGLWLRFGPSMRVVCGRVGTQNLPDRHKDTVEAMRARDAEAAARAIREDVLQGMEQLRAAFDG
ncbi:GntR family transcriptional regulator [Roseovarius sp. SCSIO 43702]|uniref:GntR family transcriptional regulator n=1 Tax=Roseovarius sp. SCSIO 43702 TaxID=2823043 RepID=UPI001C73040F|nr:GntR family transcriptional regulator [Roseovarius sp. SCSIO 43702]QYX58479.1 GntR family transcriptional regulator [Roseovarius sp. SCSIO 43702]